MKIRINDTESNIRVLLVLAVNHDGEKWLLSLFVVESAAALQPYYSFYSSFYSSFELK